MLEAKQKDLALFKLLADLKHFPEIRFAETATIEV
jgi:hypothetical protein